MLRKKKRVYSGLKKAAVVIGIAGAITGGVTVARNKIVPSEQVLYVIDGDSFKIGRDQTIRLAALDAPEKENCAGEEAKAALTKMIGGRHVILKEMKTDRYGRIMAMVYLEDGENVNEYMIKNGLALHIWDTSTQNQVLDAANDFARAHALGIFSPKCYQETPPNPKCVIKGNILERSDSREYTMPGCNLYNLSVVEKYKGEDWFCTEAEAKKAGFVKSPNCP